jgi:hypothetical protein
MEKGSSSMTNRIPSRTDLLARLDFEEVEWKTMLTEFGTDRMEIPGVTDDWTFKDVAAHLNGWRQPYVDSFLAVLQHHPAPELNWPVDVGPGLDEPDDKVQVINDWFYEQNHDRPLDEILAESQQQWDDLHTAVKELPDAALYDRDVFSRLGGDSLAEAITNGGLFSHFHEEHEPTLRAWLTQEQPETEEIK